MKNEYSPLVKQIWRQQVKAGNNASMAQVFRRLFSAGEIDENGEPTQQAIAHGYDPTVPMAEPAPHEVIAALVEQNPLYRNIDDEHFIVTPGGGLGIDEFGQRIVANRIANDPNYLHASRDAARLLLHLLDSENDD